MQTQVQDLQQTIERLRAPQDYMAIMQRLQSDNDWLKNRIENLELFKNNGDHMRSCHPDGWKRRKVRGKLAEDTIHNIVSRVYLPTNTHRTCFCGRNIEARNLCASHYNWAYVHKLF